MGTDIFSRQVDAAEALQALPGHSHTLWPPDSTGSNQENVNLGRAPWGPPAHPVALSLPHPLACPALPPLL